MTALEPHRVRWILIPGSTLAKKWRLGTDEDVLVLRLNLQANFPEQRRAQAGPLSGHIAMRSLPDGSFSGLLRKSATANPFTQASCSSWSSNGHTSTTVWQKSRSVPHFLQPPAIDKEPESNAKMYVNQRRDEMARTWKHILRHDHFRAKYRYVGVFFERRFQPLSVGGFFSNQRESISRCPKSPFPSKTQNRQIARTSPLIGLDVAKQHNMSPIFLIDQNKALHPCPCMSFLLLWWLSCSCGNNDSKGIS